MTIQQGTTPYIYPLTDAVMPVALNVFAGVAGIYKDRAWLRSLRAPNPFYGDSVWKVADATVLELNDRYLGFAPYQGTAYPMSSEVNPAVKEIYPLLWQESQRAGIRVKDTTYRDTVGLAFLLSAFGLGHDTVESVDKVTSQSVIEHYLFGSVPVLTRTQDAQRLDVTAPVITPSPDIAPFVARMTQYAGLNTPIGYWSSAVNGMTVTVYDEFFVIPKLDTENWHVEGTVDGLYAHYHGLMMAKLTPAQQTAYVAGNWSLRIRKLCAAAVWAQYHWSYRCKQNFTLS